MTRPIYDHVHAMRENLCRDDSVCERCGTPEMELKALGEPMFRVPPAGSTIAADAIASAAIASEIAARLTNRPPTPPLPPEPRELPVARLPGNGRRVGGFVALMAFCGLVVALGAHELEREIDDLEYQLDVAERRTDKLRLMVHTHHRTTIGWDGDRKCILSIHHESGRPARAGGEVAIIGEGGPAHATCDDFAWTRATTWAEVDEAPH